MGRNDAAATKASSSRPRPPRHARGTRPLLYRNRRHHGSRRATATRLHLSITDLRIAGPALCVVLSRAVLNQLAVDSRHRALCINILADDQEAICAQFALAGEDKFAAVEWHPPASNGSPQIAGALATIEADLEFEHGAGDHTIVVAHVTTLQAHPGRPLLFYRGGTTAGYPACEQILLRWDRRSVSVDDNPDAAEAVYASLTNSVRRLVDATIRSQVDLATIASVQQKIDAAADELCAALMPGSFGLPETSDGRTLTWGQRRDRRAQRLCPRRCLFITDQMGVCGPTSPSEPPTKDLPDTSTAVSVP